MERIRKQTDGSSELPPEHVYIARLSNVRGGNPIVAGTRIGVHDVVALLQNGETVDSIITQSFPALTRAQVYACLTYYEDHRGEIDLLVARQTSPGEASWGSCSTTMCPMIWHMV